MEYMSNCPSIRESHENRLRVIKGSNTAVGGTNHRLRDRKRRSLHSEEWPDMEETAFWVAFIQVFKIKSLVSRADAPLQLSRVALGL